MEQEMITIIDEQQEHIGGKFIGRTFLLTASVMSDSGRREDILYIFPEEAVKKIESLIGFNEYISSLRNGRLEWLDEYLAENDISVEKTCYNNEEHRVVAGEQLRWTFYEDDSDFNGNDFEYKFYFDEENSEKLRRLMFADGKYSSVKEWMEANVRDQKTGSDFEDYCIMHGIHGERTVYEDYPGGVYYTTGF